MSAPLRPTPAEHVTAMLLRREVLLGRARIVAPSLRRVSDDDVIRLAVAVCA